MRQVIKGIALLILLAIIIFIVWCFLLGKCSGKTFSFIPPRPNTSTGRNRPRNNNNNNNVSGSGSGNAGAGGSGSGSVSLNPQGQKKEDCGFLGLGCWWKNITEGKTIFGVPMTPFGQGIRIPLVVP